jgi:hypothetical protein
MRSAPPSRPRDAHRSFASGSRPEKIVFDDLIRGEVEFDNALLGDFVIVRNDGMPLYHFVVVVDDEAMGITHVVRGEDHLSNTPKHIALIRALGYREPRFGHIPLILNPDRSKMSKRKSQTSITAYREEGYLPEAMVNFMAFLGWSPGTEEEIFSLDELAKRFDLAKVHKGGAVFDRDRLDHLNGVYIRAMTDEQLAIRLRSWIPHAVADADLLRIVPLIKERMVTLGDAASLVGFVWEPDEVVASWYAPELLHPKKGGPDEARAALERAAALFGELDDARLQRRCPRAALPRGGRCRRHEGRRVLLPDPGGGDRTDGLAAALRLARAARPRSCAGARRAGAREAGGGRGMTFEEPRLDALIDADLLVPIRSSSGEMPEASALGADAFRHGTDDAGERFIAAFTAPEVLSEFGPPGSDHVRMAARDLFERAEAARSAW